MATVYWVGGAAPVAKVVTCTIGGTVEAGDIFKITMGAKTLSYSAGTTNAETEATALAAAWNALSATTYPEFAEITAAATSGGALTLTHDTAGTDFSVTLATTESNGGAADDQTFTQSDTTANAGPNDWSTAANWSGGAVPVNGDDVVIENSAVSIYYGLAQSAVTLASLVIESSYTGAIGLPPDNANDYVEYRDQYLAIGATVLKILGGTGQVNIDVGSAQTAATITSAARSNTTGLPAILLKGTHVGNTVTVTKGDVGVAVKAAETATAATLAVGYDASLAGDATVVCGSGVTLTTINQSGGSLTIESNATTINQTEGTLHVTGAGAVTTLNLDGGTCYYKSTGTCTTANVGNGGVLDFRRNPSARTVTNCTVNYGAAVYDPAKTVTWTNGLDLYRCSVDEITLDVGSHLTLTPSAI